MQKLSHLLVNVIKYTVFLLFVFFCFVIIVF